MTTRLVPNANDYSKFQGGRGSQLWQSCNDSWRCPVCGRSKFEVMRWTTVSLRRGIGQRRLLRGWGGYLCEHHYHEARLGSASCRFSCAIICDQCKAADNRAKVILGIPVDYSFSPEELAMFVQVEVHGRFAINWDAARQVYDQLIHAPCGYDKRAVLASAGASVFS